MIIHRSVSSVFFPLREFKLSIVVLADRNSLDRYFMTDVSYIVFDPAFVRLFPSCFEVLYWLSFVIDSLASARYLAII